MNETLEAIARALFKSRFVDFDPVRAKAEGRAPAGMDADTAKLFPSVFVEHDGEFVPEAWTRAPLGDWVTPELALASMDVFVALLTEKFHESNWTDHEVGYALGRGVPIVAVWMGRDPYGFIGKFQALRCNWTETPAKLLGLLMKQPRMIDVFPSAVAAASNFDAANTLAEVLPSIERLTEAQAQRLVDAFNTNGEVSGSFGFAGNSRWPGLAYHLQRLTGQLYQVDKGNIRAVT